VSEIYLGKSVSVDEDEFKTYIADEKIRRIDITARVGTHIKDTDQCVGKEADDINNLMFNGRLIHQHFDGIETTPINTPSFLIRYIVHVYVLRANALCTSCLVHI
jgi:hypothetical protein